jgi:hypothetical protein
MSIRYRLKWEEDGVTRHLSESMQDWHETPEEAAKNPPRHPWMIEERTFPLHPLTTSFEAVLVNEEYGYRNWLWRTPFSETELRQFWSQLLSIPPIHELPGEKEAVVVGPGNTIWGGGENPFVYLTPGTPLWVCHLHLDDDSSLTPPDGEGSLRHAGFVEENLEDLVRVATEAQ